jgi:hypothetical protein
LHRRHIYGRVAGCQPSRHFAINSRCEDEHTLIKKDERTLMNQDEHTLINRDARAWRRASNLFAHDSLSDGPLPVEAFVHRQHHLRASRRRKTAANFLRSHFGVSIAKLANPCGTLASERVVRSLDERQRHSGSGRLLDDPGLRGSRAPSGLRS